jgi:branched-subunit amino acid aminotransferase/4-amino-4-deoxychorismate lyase
MQVWINGTLGDDTDARVSIFDAGFQHGVALFETMRASHGVVFRARAHLERLADSAKTLRLAEDLRLEPLYEAMLETLAANGLESGRVRLTLTGGDLNLLHGAGDTRVEPTIVIVAQPPTEYPDAFFEQGVRVTIADGRANPFEASAGHKIQHYWPRLQALQLAAQRQAGEALWFTVSNHLVGGSVSNIFLFDGEDLLTPIARGEEEQGAIPSAVLPGVTRNAIIQLADSFGIGVETRMLDIEDLLAADEIFLTNSSWGVLPVVGVEKEKIGDAAVGDVTQRLRSALLGMVERETSVVG